MPIYDPVMSRLHGRLAAVTGAVPLLLLALVGPSYAAGGSLQQCMDQAVNHNGEPPTCTKVNGQWVASWPDDGGLAGGPGGGIPGGFVALFVLALFVGIGITIWKVSTARQLARQSGMDPNVATGITLLTDNGLDATYVASSLRGRTQPDAAAPATPAAPPQTASSRLEELKTLLDGGMVTQQEYDERRKAIIDSV